MAIEGKMGFLHDFKVFIYLFLSKGVDLTKNATAMLLSQTSSQDLGSANDLTTLVTALPNQGILYPQERRAIHFRFSPRYTKSNKGWKSSDQPPPRKDYTLFMHIETVGSVAGISDKTKGGTSNGGELQFCLFLGVFIYNNNFLQPFHLIHSKNFFRCSAVSPHLFKIFL